MKERVVKEFYLMALVDLNNGASLDEMYETLQMYEEIEDYEACAGILKAIKEYKK